MERTDQSFGIRFLESSVVGAARGVVGLPFEQPLDRIKTEWQTDPSVRSLRAVVIKIHREEGFKSFFRGGMPNAIRISSKSVYRFPMILAVPDLWKGLLPVSFYKRFPAGEAALTGLSIAGLESAIVAPLERSKVWLMTNPDLSKRWRDLLFQWRSGKMPDLYRGFWPTLAKSSGSWLSFLVSYEWLKALVKRHSEGGEFTFAHSLVISIPVAGINTLAVMPFDVVKTQVQQVRTRQLSTWGAVKSLSRLGPAVFFTGWQLKFAHSLFQAGFTLPLIAWVQRTWQKRSS